MSTRAGASNRWSRRATREIGGVGSVLWPKINALAAQPGVVNLGQGFPDFAPPVAAIDAATAALRNPALNQYAPVGGTMELKQAVSQLYGRMFPNAPTLNPAGEVCIVTSGTEGIYAAMQALIDPDDEVLLFEPAFPWYQPCIRMAGGIPVSVELQPPEFAIPSMDQLRKLVTPRTKMVIFNTPHNPTGHMASEEELARIAALCQEHDLLCLADEVYEVCAFPGSGRRHRRLCDVEGMRGRTLTIGGASKLLSLTGWRVGWVCGPEELIAALRTAQSYQTYSAPTPLQHGCAAAIQDALRDGGDLSFGGLGTRMEANWNRLATALRQQGVTVCPAEGGYFLVVDVAATGMDDWGYCKWIAEERKVAAVPMGMFYSSSGEQRRTLVRFAVCKRHEVIEEAAKRLAPPFPSARSRM